MPSSPGGIRVNPNGQSAVVTFTLPNGGTPVAYSSRSGAGTISLPATVTTETTFWFQEQTVLTVSALVGTQQSATAAGTTAAVDLSAGGVAGLLVAVVAASGGSFVAQAPAPTDVAATDTAALQGLLAAALSAGGGRILLRAGQYRINSPLILGAGVALVGCGHRATKLHLADGANCDVIQTNGLGSFTNTTAETAAAGVPTGFEIRGLTVDGNKTNNSSGRGVAIFGKRYIVEDVVVTATAGDGFSSELGHGFVGAQPVDDLPECQIGDLWVHQAGGVGFRYRGPHDGHIKSLIVSQSQLDNISIEKNATYDGACDIDFIHTYSSQTGAGLAVLGTEIHASHVISETNYHAGVYIDGNSCRIGMLSLFNNWYQYASHSPYAPAGDGHLIVTSNGINLYVGVANIRAEHGGWGISAQAPCAFGQAYIDGASSTGTGLAVDASGVRGSFEIRNFTGTGSYGYLHCSSGAARSYTDLSAFILNCATCAGSFSPGAQNDLRFRLVANTGQVADGGYWIGTLNRVAITSSGAGSGLTNAVFQQIDQYRDDKKVVSYRKTGWGIPTGTPARTTFDPSTVTHAQLAAIVAALVTDLHGDAGGHGLIGT